MRALACSGLLIGCALRAEFSCSPGGRSNEVWVREVRCRKSFYGDRLTIGLGKAISRGFV